jgi:hypothetical protein
MWFSKVHFMRADKIIFYENVCFYHVSENVLLSKLFVFQSMAFYQELNDIVYFMPSSLSLLLFVETKGSL